jgi:hypothetical protein
MKINSLLVRSQLRWTPVGHAGAGRSYMVLAPASSLAGGRRAEVPARALGCSSRSSTQQSAVGSDWHLATGGDRP